MSHEYKGYTYVNEDENFWGKYYLVSFAQCLGWDSAICVNASNEGDAIDAVADYHEKNGHLGYLDYKECGYSEDDMITVGNHCWQVPSWEINIKQI